MMTHLIHTAMYLAEALTAWLYYGRLFPRKRSAGVTALAYFTCYLGMLLLYNLELPPLNTASFFLGNLVLSWAFHQCPPKTAVVHAAYLSFLMTLAELAVAWMLGLFTGEFGSFQDSLSALIAMATGCKLLYLVLALVSTRLFTPRGQDREEPRQMVLFCILPVLSTVVAVLIACLSLRIRWPAEAELVIGVSLLTLLGVNLLFFLLYEGQQRLHEENLALQLGKQRSDADAAYYQSLLAQTEAQRVLIHDIRNHLQVLDGLARGGDPAQVSAYIARLTQNLELSRPRKLCSDPILNLLLLRCRQSCQEKGIAFQCDIREGTQGLLDQPSLTTLYGNLLSNALEAAEASREKFLEISVQPHEDQGIFTICVVNSCDAPPLPGPGGRFRSRKQGPHGVGLSAISQVVRRYQGLEHLYFHPEEKKFHHIVQLPLAKQEQLSH